jgi:hypothetical protein
MHLHLHTPHFPQGLPSVPAVDLLNLAMILLGLLVTLLLYPWWSAS